MPVALKAPRTSISRRSLSGLVGRARISLMAVERAFYWLLEVPWIEVESCAGVAGCAAPRVDHSYCSVLSRHW